MEINLLRVTGCELSEPATRNAQQTLTNKILDYQLIEF